MGHIIICYFLVIHSRNVIFISSTRLSIMDSTDLQKNILPTIIGYSLMFLLFGGSVFMVSIPSKDSGFRLLHVSVYLIVMTVFILRMIRNPKMNIFNRLLPLLIGLSIHYYILVKDPSNQELLHRKYFWTEVLPQEMKGMFIIMPYAFVGFIAGVFVPIYALKGRRDRIRRTGIDAFGEIIHARDLQGRLTEGAHRLYEIKLQLRITGHAKSPFTVSDKFWISEFYIHKLSTGQSIPIKVDRVNHRLIALNFTQNIEKEENSIQEF